MKKAHTKWLIKGLVFSLIIFVLVGTGTAIATSGSKEILVVYDNIKLMIDGVAVVPKDAAGNAVEPFICNGTTYLPVRAVASALGKSVSWDGATKTVIIGDAASIPTAENINTYGNIGGNIVNGGVAALQGDWIYYNSDGLSKIRTDGTGWTFLSTDNCEYVNVIGDWIYYRNVSDNHNIYKIKTDGTARTALTHDAQYSYTNNYINVAGAWIYYSGENENLYKIRTDGTEKTKISDNKCSYINVVGDWIYYCNDSDMDSYYSGRLYKVKTDGTQSTRLTTNGGEGLCVDGDWIYYLDNMSFLYKIRTDGTARTPFDKQLCGLNVTDGWIYYRLAGGGEGYTYIYKMRIDGTGNTIITADFPNNINSQINVVGDWIYLPYLGDVFKIRTDGTQMKLAD